MNQTPAPPSDFEAHPRPQPTYVNLPSQAPVVVYALTGITVFIYLLQIASPLFFGYAASGIDPVTFFGARISQAIYAGQIWRLITPLFLHGSFAHILFNMYALVSIGSLIERFFGRGRFLLLYFLSGFAGNVLSLLFTQGYSVGASTAIFGLISAEAIFFYKNRALFGSRSNQAISNALFIIVVNLFLGLAPSIDNWGHIGGLLGGALFAWFASPLWIPVGIAPNLHLQDERENREIALGTTLTVFIFGGLTVWAFIQNGALSF